MADNQVTLTLEASTAKQVQMFVESNRKDYFEDHSLAWCLEEIIQRGLAEITRQVKTAKKQAELRIAGKLMQEYNMSPAQARRIFADAVEAQRKAQAKA